MDLSVMRDSTELMGIDYWQLTLLYGELRQLVGSIKQVPIFVAP